MSQIKSDYPNKDELAELVMAQLKHDGPAGHHIKSFNYFLNYGITQIITQNFAIQDVVENARNDTEEDRTISEIHFDLTFPHVRIIPPGTVKHNSGQRQRMMPQEARTNNLTYSVDIYVNVNVQVTAYNKNTGNVYNTRVFDIRDLYIGKVPICIGCDYCNLTHATPDIMRRMGEDPKEPGGYMILNGTEWSINSLENVRNNTFHVNVRNDGKYTLTEGMFISKPGDAFENSHQIKLVMHHNDQLHLIITYNKGKQNSVQEFRMPFYFIYRVFSMMSDREIVDNIAFGIEQNDPVSQYIKQKLENAMRAPVPQYYRGIQNMYDPQELIFNIGVNTLFEDAQRGAFVNNEEAVRHVNNRVMDIFDRYIFPHIGDDPKLRPRKLRFLSLLINKLIRVDMGVLDPTDRDDYVNKRLDPAGISLAKVLKTQFNFSVVQNIRQQVRSELQNATFSQVKMEDSIRSSMSKNNLTRALRKAVSTGDTYIDTKYNIINRVSSQMLPRTNYMDVYRSLRIITVRKDDMGKMTERAQQLRRVHNSHLGYVDAVTSAETGSRVGKVKQMGCMMDITSAGSSGVMTNTLLDDDLVIPLDQRTMRQISEQRLALVFVNGNWIGYTERMFDLARKYRHKRRNNEIDPTATIAESLTTREINFWVDYGRVVRPLIIVYNNFDRWKSGKDKQFRQWCNITSDDVAKLRRAEIGVEDLRRRGVIEYITAEEATNMYYAYNLRTLVQHENDYLNQFTHCDIEQAIMGMPSLALPLGERSNPVRLALATNHRKQAATWFTLNFPFRQDKNTFLQYRCDRPLVSTIIDRMCPPAFQNAIIAICTYNGYNQEDSVIFNKSSVERGLFNGCFFNLQSETLEEPNTHIGRIDMSITRNIKPNASYEKLDSEGIIQKGSKVEKNDVLIGMYSMLNKSENGYHYSDKSVVYEQTETAYVYNAIKVDSADPDSYASCKVLLRSPRNHGNGSKYASRDGNKSISSNTIPESDMPFTEEGLKPDAIINSQSIPSRKAPSMIHEITLGKWCVHRGTTLDMTSFKETNAGEYIRDLENFGIKDGGYHVMYDGFTGKPMESRVFMGPVPYQRLQKFVISKQYASRQGGRNKITGQPHKGKSLGGGMRMGELEFWLLNAHGCADTFKEKCYDHSDGVEMYICTNCGKQVSINPAKKKYVCNRCGPDKTRVVSINSSWSMNLFYNELRAMNVDYKFHVSSM